MKRHFFVTVAVICCSLLLCASLALAQVTLFDGDFNPDHWDDDPYILDPGTSILSITTNPTGGNPLANREMTYRFDAGTTSYIWLFCRYTATSYNPSVQGAIASINYSEDARVADSSALVNINIPSRIGLLQNNTIYRSTNASTIHSQPWPSEWQGINFDGLVVGNFFKHNDGPGPNRPDFSETGSEIFFGYIRGNQHSATDYEFTTSIDNWSVTINQQTDATYTINKVVLNDAEEEITAAEVGDTITYRITFTNTGGVDLTGAVVTDTLPEHLQYNSAIATPAPTTDVNHDAGSVTWSLDTLASGGSASLDINMEVLAEADQQVLTNQAEVTHIDAPAAAGQTASVDLQIGNIANVELTSSEREWNENTTSGLDVTLAISLTITNHGPEIAADVILAIDQLEIRSGDEDVSMDYNKTIESTDAAACNGEYTDVTAYNCSIGNLDSGESVDVRIVIPFGVQPGEKKINYTFSLQNTPVGPLGYPTTTSGTHDLTGGTPFSPGRGGGNCFISSALNQPMDRQ